MPKQLQTLLLVCCFFLGRSQTRPALIPYTDGVKWGYADTFGRVIIPPQWEEVRFFRNHKAVVIAKKNPRNSWGYTCALIDEGGHYLIDPKMGWNGGWSGSWGNTALNTTDSNGRHGMIDTAANLMIAYQWDGGAGLVPPMTDSFKIVYLDGLAGIIDRAGSLVVPCKWGQINPTENLASIRAFMVRDPDNISGNNSNGVADVHNRTIIPPRYNDITLFTLPDGKQVFKAASLASNEGTSSYSAFYSNASVKYFEYPGGQQISNPEKTLLLMQRDEYTLPGGYIVSSSGGVLMNAGRKVLVPCCKFWRISGDTIMLRDEKRVGKDSVTLTISYLDAHSLKEVAPRRTLLLYSVEERRDFSEQHFFEGHADYGERREPVRIPIPGYGEVQYLFKDSLLYSVTERVDSRGMYYLVQGQTRGGREPGSYVYYAVLDSNLDYAILPERLYTLHGYNPADGFAIGSLYTSRSAREAYLLIDHNGHEIIHPLPGKILHAFRWQDRIYTFLQMQDECNSEASGTHTYLTDADGKPLPQFGNYDVLKMYFSSVKNAEGMPNGSVWVVDSAQRIGILYPDGGAVYPKLNFKYLRIAPTVNGWFLVCKAYNEPTTLVDSADREILKGFSVYSITPATMTSELYLTGKASIVTVSRVYNVAAKNANGKDATFYLDDTGKAYYSAP